MCKKYSNDVLCLLGKASVFSVVSMILAAGCSSNMSVSTVVAGTEEKSRMLEERVTKFNLAVYWSAYEEAMTFVVPDMRSELGRRWRKNSEGQKIVEQKVSDVIFDGGNNEAEVEVKTRYFQQPVYIVKDRVENQKWRYYRLSGGWYLYALEDKSEGEDAAQPQKQERRLPDGQNPRGSLR